MLAYVCAELRGNGARDVAVLADKKIMVKERNNENVLGIVLAGGRGERLFPLTNDRAKPAAFDLYNESWPIRTVAYDNPPAKFVFDEDGRRGESVNSIVGEGTIISGSLVRGSVIGRNVKINSYSLIEDSIIMDRVEIGRGCRIRRAIIDKRNVIPAGTEIGANFARDRERYFVSEDDIVVVERGDLSLSGSTLVAATAQPYWAEL